MARPSSNKVGACHTSSLKEPVIHAELLTVAKGTIIDFVGGTAQDSK